MHLVVDHGYYICTSCGLDNGPDLEPSFENMSYMAYAENMAPVPTYVPDVHLERHLFKLDPPLPHEFVTHIREIFPKVYEVFFQICEPQRRNFLSYQFVIAELLKMLGVVDPYTEYGIQRLKTPARYKQHAAYWEKIVPRLGS